MEDTIKSPFDKQPAEGSCETIDRQLAQQEQREQQNGEAEFRDQLGGAVLEVWGDLPRDLQEAIFEIAMRNAPEQRNELAKLLHDRHPRTEPSPQS